MLSRTVLLACGALAREVIALKNKHEWQVDVLALPALLHNHPERIPGAIKKRINELKQVYERIVVVYGDCGTSGALDRLLLSEEIIRVSGPHCYEMYANGDFEQIMSDEPGTFFLTDYLLQSFDHLVLEGLGITENPELREIYFKNYRRVIYLAQREDPLLDERAQWAANSLQLPLEIHRTGYGKLETRLLSILQQ